MLCSRIIVRVWRVEVLIFNRRWTQMNADGKKMVEETPVNGEDGDSTVEVSLKAPSYFANGLSGASHLNIKNTPTPP